MGFFVNKFNRETDLVKLKGTRKRNFGTLRATNVYCDHSVRDVTIQLTENKITPLYEG